MREVIIAAIEALKSGRQATYCRLVETRGSTPQKAGAAMLVYADGEQVGTLGGGCVEAEVRRRAMAAIASGRAEIASFQLDHDYGWDDGLICGGRMTSVIEPLAGPAAEPQLVDYFECFLRLSANGGCTEAVAFDARKTGLPVPSSYLFDADCRQAATIRANAATDDAVAEIRGLLRPLAERPRPYGRDGVAFLPMLSRCRLVIVGGGHVGKAVAELAADLDFDVWIAEDRAEFASAERFPRAERRIVGPIDEALPDLDITADTYCLIVTRGHNNDARALFHLADRGARYVGLIGSRRKIKLIFEQLLDQGISAAALAGVHAPVGIDIGSQTVAEIAVSIAAELVSHRNRSGHVPGRPQGVPVAERFIAGD
jgi:xanthine dehydrogenase accessory factor